MRGRSSKKLRVLARGEVSWIGAKRTEFRENCGAYRAARSRRNFAYEVGAGGKSACDLRGRAAELV